MVNNQEYERTGRQVRISEDELIEIVLDKIDTYKDLHPRERRNYPNPMRDPIITKIASGKTIEIPRNIVEKALEINRACGTAPLMSAKSERIERMESMGSDSGSGIRDESKIRASGAHTRLSNRNRYADADPFIMNEDLRGQKLVGSDSEIASDAVYGDGSDRYSEFNDRMKRFIDNSHMESDLEDISDPYNVNNANNANSMRKSSRSVPNLPHLSGPARSIKDRDGRDNDYMDKVSGINSDISPEGGSASVYASLDDESEFGSSGEEYHESYESYGKNNNYIKGDYELDYDSNPDYSCDNCSENNGYDMEVGRDVSRVKPYTDYDNLDNVDYSYDSHSSDDSMPDEMRKKNRNRNENVSKSDDSDSKSKYNYALWLVLIIILTILIYNYVQKKGKTGSIVP